MAIRQKRKWCYDCRQYRRFIKDDKAGALPGCGTFLLCVFTLGLAIPFVLLAKMGLAIQPYLCTECGRRG